MKILCSGNPTNEKTIASSIQKIFPNTDFASRTTGYDLKLLSNDTLCYFKNQILKYNVFINASYIDSGCQLQLLDVTYKQWMKENIQGHIINIGSTIEWQTDNDYYYEYRESKKKLKLASLDLSNQTGITGVKSTHIIVGGINDGLPEHQNWVLLDHVAQTIKWLLEQPANVSLVQLQ